MLGIGANAEVLHGRANEIKGDSDDLGMLIERITNRINALESDWNGAAAQSFVNQWESFKKSFVDAQDLLNQIGQQLDDAASAYENFDAEMASRIGY